MGIELWHSIMDHVWFPQRIVSKKRAKNAKTLLSNFGKAIVRFQLKDFFSFALWSMIWIYLLICCALNKTIWKFFAKAQLKGGSMFCVSESKLPALSYIPIFFSRERFELPSRLSIHRLLYFCNNEVFLLLICSNQTWGNYQLVNYFLPISHYNWQWKVICQFYESISFNSTR